jgi:hypothetical protein
MAVSLAIRTGRALLPRNIIFLLLVFISVRRWVRPEGLGKLKKIIHLIGSQIRDLQTCSIVPQPIRYHVSRILSRVRKQNYVSNVQYMKVTLLNVLNLSVDESTQEEKIWIFSFCVFSSTESTQKDVCSRCKYRYVDVLDSHNLSPEIQFFSQKKWIRNFFSNPNRGTGKWNGWTPNAGCQVYFRRIVPLHLWKIQVLVLA